MHGLVMLPLAVRLRRMGYKTRIFSYPSLRRSPVENARGLADLVTVEQADKVHFLAHSLGGIVVRHLFHDFPEQSPGRVVTLGTPHRGSAAAGRLVGGKMRFALGRSVEQGLLEAPLLPWPAGRQLGSIAGTLNVGLGRLFGGVEGPADGTVAVAETQCEGMTDHICLPVSHTGLLLASSPAEQAGVFFATAHFDHGHRDLR
jgi:pimeloyl-ACP methyl ester carboxylesterase